MIRKLALLAPFAVLTLAACDGPSALTKAEPGECFAVTGRQTNGAPKWEKIPCANPAATPTVATTQPVASPPLAPAAGAPACPTAKPTACPTATRTTSRLGRASAGRRDHRQVRTRTSLGGGRTQSREYARAPQDDGYLLGGPADGDRYSYRAEPYPPMPPSPPMYRYYERDRTEGYDSRRDHGDDDYAAPPYEGPRYDRRGDRSLEGGQGYSERPEYRSGPPSAYRGESYRSRGESYSYSEESSSSYSSSRSGASHSRRGPCCDTQPGYPVRRLAPMNGPHFPVDEDGFLTWRGKTPGY